MEVHTKPFVILRHTFEDDPGRNHYDYLFETEAGDDPNARTLVAFRVFEPSEDGFMFTAERLADHRRLYLDYEGPISSDGSVDRGRVIRIREGEAVVRDSGTSMGIAVRFDEEDEYRFYAGVHANDDMWIFMTSTPDSIGISV